MATAPPRIVPDHSRYVRLCNAYSLVNAMDSYMLLVALKNRPIASAPRWGALNTEAASVTSGANAAANAGVRAFRTTATQSRPGTSCGSPIAWTRSRSRVSEQVGGVFGPGRHGHVASLHVDRLRAYP